MHVLAAHHIRHAFEVLFLGYLVVVVVGLLLGAYVLHKVGWNPWLTLLTLIPVINVVAYLLFVFLEWPVSKAAKAAGWHPGRQAGRGIPPAGYPAQPQTYSPPPAGGYTPPPSGGYNLPGS